MDIQTINLPISSIRLNHPDGLKEIKISSNKKQTRYTIDTSCLNPESAIQIHILKAHLSVPIRPSRAVGACGWSRLRVQGNSGGDEVSAYRFIDRGRTTILILRNADPANFMASLPDDTPLGDITLAGTHESCALYGYPISQCQQPSTPIERQLMDGIRWLDVRLRVVGDELLMYHGPRPQRSTLPQLLTTLHDFLQTHPTETLILCIKEESPPFHPQFSSILYKAFQPYLDNFWFVEERIPKLGEVRGKGILMSRFERGNGWEGGMGIHPSTWPDSRREGFEWDCQGTRFRISDWYRVQSFLEIPEKFEVVKSQLLPTLLPTPPSQSPQFTLTYTTASSFPLSLPTMIAKGFGWPSYGLGVYGMNDRILGWLLGVIKDGGRVRGCLALDFYRQTSGDGDVGDIVGLLVGMNFV